MESPNEDALNDRIDVTVVRAVNVLLWHTSQTMQQRRSIADSAGFGLVGVLGKDEWLSLEATGSKVTGRKELSRLCKPDFCLRIKNRTRQGEQE